MIYIQLMIKIHIQLMIKIHNQLMINIRIQLMIMIYIQLMIKDNIQLICGFLALRRITRQQAARFHLHQVEFIMIKMVMMIMILWF